MFESPRLVARTYTFWLQAFIGALCTAWLITPEAQQAALLALVGAEGEGATAAATFFAQVNIAFAAATIGARAYKQPSLHQAEVTKDEQGPAA